MKVLVVEDDAVTRNVLCQMLRKREDYEVVAVESAEEAQDFCSSDFFPLIILDLNLPKMNGLDFSRWLRRRPGGDRSYILVGTATAVNETNARTLAEILASGADDYISKPYNAALFRIRLAVAETQIGHIEQRKRLEEALKEETDFGFRRGRYRRRAYRRARSPSQCGPDQSGLSEIRGTACRRLARF